ncbi:hypothetical protein [Alsobacter sp. R-9]
MSARHAGAAGAALVLLAAAAAAQTPPSQAPGPGTTAPQLVQIIVRAQGTGDRYASTYSVLCEEGRFCTAVFDVNRRRAAGAATTPPTRVEIGIWSRPDGEVVLVPVTGTTKLMLNCKPSQTVATKGRGDAPRIRYSVHEPDSACGGAVDRAPPEKAIAAIEVVVRPAALLRGQRT